MTYRLDSDQLRDGKVLEDSEDKVRREVTDDIVCRLGVLFQQQNLQSNVPRHTRIKDEADAMNRG